jgi:hypothetical protein
MSKEAEGAKDTEVAEVIKERLEDSWVVVEEREEQAGGSL